MEINEYIRIPFTVNAVQVTLENVDEVAKWCGGTVGTSSYKVMGTKTELPSVKVPGNGPKKGELVDALLGHWVVEHKGSFRVYRPQQFEGSFEKPGKGVSCALNSDITARLDVITHEHTRLCRVCDRLPLNHTIDELVHCSEIMKQPDFVVTGDGSGFALPDADKIRTFRVINSISNQYNWTGALVSESKDLVTLRFTSDENTMDDSQFSYMWDEVEELKGKHDLTGELFINSPE